MTTLYRKYRPQHLSDILGQDQVTTILSQAIATNSVAHAYLFAGPRGTGKTSVARILAKALNCQKRADSLKKLPCNDCDHCRAIDQGSFLDVLELDAASNRGIDEIRSLKEQVAVSPLQGSFKVYILDEVHMLTNEAFNALLKTLEEPPKHVIFILCTTELHKVPVTITSRCQRFTFSRASVTDLETQLHQIAVEEKITIDDQAIALLARQADGGYRDAAMLLEQVAIARPDAKGKNAAITAPYIEQQLGLPGQELCQRLVSAFLNHQPDQAITAIETFTAGGGNIQALTADLISQFRLLLLAATSPQAVKSLADTATVAQLQQWAKQSNLHQLTSIVRKLLDVQHQRSAYPALALELAFIEPSTAPDTATAPVVNPQKVPAAPLQPAKTPTPAASPAAPAQTSPNQTPEAKPKEQPTPSPSVQDKDDANPKTSDSTLPNADPPAEPSNIPAPDSPPGAGDAIGLHQSWLKILDAVRPRTRSLEAILRDCTPLSFDGTILLLQFWYAFHKKQLEVDKNRRLVEEVATTVFGVPVKVKCQLGDKSQRPKKRPMSEEDIHNVAPVEEGGDLVDAAVEIFGGEFID